MMDRNEHPTGALAHFLAAETAEVPSLQEFVLEGCATGLTRLRTAEGEDWIIACVDAGTVPATHTAAIHRLLLQANNLWAGTRGNTLGLYGDNDDTVVLSRSLRAAEATPPALEKILRHLIDDARQWRTWLVHLADDTLPTLD
ncbi:type III secretion system chaperone [Castellaniella daejeonensis]|jgi:hypothetical protein